MSNHGPSPAGPRAIDIVWFVGGAVVNLAIVLTALLTPGDWSILLRGITAIAAIVATTTGALLITFSMQRISRSKEARRSRPVRDDVRYALLESFYFRERSPDIPNLKRWPDHRGNALPFYSRPEWVASPGEELAIQLKFSSEPQQVTPRNQAFIDHLSRDLGDRIWDQPIYRLVSVERPDLSAPLSLTFAAGTYFDFIGSCEVLAGELTSILQNTRGTSSHLGNMNPEDIEVGALAKASRKLKHRRQVAPDLKSIEDLTRRSCKVGLSVVFALAKGDGMYRILLARRSMQMAENAGMLHVIPAGTFQPSRAGKAAADNEDFDLRLAVLREVAEECFGLDLERGERGLRADTFQTEPGIRELVALLSGGEAKLLWTAFGYDMLSAKPELTGLLKVDDPKFLELIEGSTTGQRALFKTNWESTSLDILAPIIGDAEWDRALREYTFLPAGWTAIKLAQPWLTET